jgi:hypothetical protein
MRIRLARWLAAMLTLSACASAILTSCSHVERVLTEDVNRDGRPDAWRVYGPDGHLTEVARDTNLDGRPDVREYYDRGALVRRESDRNFNDQIDLVEDFDAVTGEHVRSVIDLDDDGCADLLVLFQNARPVFVEYAARRPVAPAIRPRSMVGRAPVGDSSLRPLDDPFRGDLVVRSAHRAVGSPTLVSLSIVGSTPPARRRILAWLVPASRVAVDPSPLGETADLLPGSPRGPPPLTFLPA